MFTGLVEHVGEVLSVSGNDPLKLSIAIPPAWGLLPIGCSVAVDGVCLTVIERRLGAFTADVGAETWQRTALSGLKSASLVHLERPLRLGAPLDGHLVLGHVDGLASFLKSEPQGATTYLFFAAPPDLISMIAPQGSVALAGVSLTVVNVDNNKSTFSVAIVPHTLQNTKLGALKAGAPVNIEVDPLARYVKQALSILSLQKEKQQSPGITMELLQKGGYL